jgi:hypothetical protein
MHNIEAAIKEYCAKNLPPEQAWIRFLERRFPKIAGTMDVSQSMRKEFADHLQDSYQAHIEKGNSADDAWKLAQKHFGDTELLSREIRKIRRQSCKCLLIRFLAILAYVVLPMGNEARIGITSFIHPQAIFLMAACAVLGYWITRKRDSVSLRKYALYGAWLGLFWGLFEATTMAANDPSRCGMPIAFMLLSTFNGLFIAAPAARRLVPASMLILCQAGVSIALLRSGLFPLISGGIDARTLKMAAAACVVSLLAGLLIFDIRKLHRRTAGIAALGMVFTWIKLLVHIRGPQSIGALVLATSLPALIAVLMILPIQKLQQFLLQEAG